MPTSGTAEVNVTSLTITAATAIPRSTYYVGSTYSLTATCDVTSSMAFTDNGNVILASVNGVLSQTFWPNANGVVQIPWVPSSTGSHTTVAQGCAGATQSDAPVQIVVNVINKP